ncbi:MAG: MFS transporter [Actinomycetota bacterium]|nr:MFS transporter [Actinomycetota bacterium]
MPATSAPGRPRLADGLALATFVALGLPDGMLGTAWPSIHASLGVPVGYLGLVLLASTAGSVAVTIFVGRLVRRLEVAPLLAGGLGVGAAAATGFALSPAFGALAATAVLFGLSAGTVDGGLNTVVGLSGRTRLLNLLHGAYGVGTSIGPLVVTAAIVTGSWRPAYVVLLATDATIGGLWLASRGDIGSPGRPEGPAAPVTGVETAEMTETSGSGSPGAPRRGAVAAGMVVFFFYTGLEVAAGQWETTFDRLHLHLSATQAGLATFGYWGALTAVRIGIALSPRAPGQRAVVVAGTGTAVAAVALIWWQPGAAATVVGFVVLGGGLAGIFPALVALTPARLGARRASNAIAWQVGAAAAGGAGLSALVGAAVAASGPGVLGPALSVLAAALVAAELALERIAPVQAASGGTREARPPA